MSIGGAELGSVIPGANDPCLERTIKFESTLHGMTNSTAVELTSSNQHRGIGILRRMDLYGRLEELQGMTRLLIEDVGRLQGDLGAGKPDPSATQETNRRFYIRAVFALVEAFAEQLRSSAIA